MPLKEVLTVLVKGEEDAKLGTDAEDTDLVGSELIT